jgi:rod shape-determining protein MreC
MASGTSGSFINNGLYTAVTVAAYPFWITLDGVKRGADYVGDFVFSYHSARREADELRRELFEAMPALAERGELRAENSRLQAMLQFARSHPELTVLPARVISRSGGILTIDRGAMHGVQEYMCAITKDGVVGVVTRVEPATANVATLHSTDCSIGARIRGSRITGVIKGSGNAFSHICTMEYIDLKEEVREGDHVVTSGFSAHPAGLPIGTVTGTKQEKQLHWAVRVEPAADPYRLDELLLVLQARIGTDELAGTDPPEDLPPTEATMPDTRPIQERYAP